MLEYSLKKLKSGNGYFLSSYVPELKRKIGIFVSHEDYDEIPFDSYTETLRVDRTDLLKDLEKKIEVEKSKILPPKLIFQPIKEKKEPNSSQDDLFPETIPSYYFESRLINILKISNIERLKKLFN
jgi:hypothetical protein